MDIGGAGHDVTAQVVRASLPIGYHAARLFDQEGSGGDVPNRKAKLEEPVEHARGHPGEVEGGRPGSANNVLRPAEHPLQHRQVPGQEGLVAEGQTGGHDGPVDRAIAHLDPAGTLPGADTAGPGKSQPEQGGPDGPGLRPPVHHQGDRHGHQGKADGEVRGPVQRVDDPEPLAPAPAALLSHHRDVGSHLGEESADGVLALAIGRCHVVTGALALHSFGRPAGGPPGHDLGAHIGRLLGDAAEFGQVLGRTSTRPFRTLASKET